MVVRRGPRARLLLTLAALASLIVGYYLGQAWQRRPLDELSAIVYPTPRLIDYGELLATRTSGTDQPWRLFVVADTTAPKCAELLRHHALVHNRLATHAGIQKQLRLTLLAYDDPDDDQVAHFAGSLPWLDVLAAAPQELAELSAQLGIQPLTDDWCSPLQSNAVLVSPAREAWALVPHEAPVIMARNITTIIEFVE
ncbi:MAG: hypothetical protein KDI82_01750 [Gammaproteobacteria bacterium]|nr:hypothetical protein [Gammaproteobacteria bacterium]